ncbi:COP23 domain-containing protein [Pseudanabaena sp. BC1403]|uniref:COP23 domain-containing protein n=1 Tax=Pseudanabaena sp. BC1403 TaxID=2043171 RepID=UPI000CD852FE|nr:COP23 domain-containing protein [Pseudanabaena sp. BC1403]
MNYSTQNLPKFLKKQLGYLSAIALGFPLLASPSLAQIIPVETTPSSNPSTLPSENPNDKAANPTDNKTARFSCQSRDGQYIVVYQPKSQPQKYFPWAAPSTMGDGWSPEKRCNEISRRLESYRPDGLLEMKTSTENGYNVICATTDKNSACRIVLTVPNGQDPIATRDRVFGNLATADSGQATTAVNTYRGRDRSLNDITGDLGLGIDLKGINGVLGSVLSPSRPVSNVRSGNLYLKPFLDPSDGGTGASINNSGFTGGRKLNPDNFR